MNRVVGLETEYGCLSRDVSGPAAAVSRIRNWIFDRNRFGVADMHQRDWDEPAGNGGFLYNGGRAYVDMGHLEYCTPECLSLEDLVRYDRAGDAMLLRGLRDLRLAQQVSFVRNNVDHYSGATFGCHENYLVRRAAPLTETNVMSLLAFLTMRVLYTGAGRVGCSAGVEARGESGADGSGGIGFQISQRADYINNDLFEWVQFNRAIINTRDEPLADARRFRRLHLLHGDTSVLPATLALKVGTTALVLDLLEADALPRCMLADAVSAFRALSHRLEPPWRVTLADGRESDAVDLLGVYYEAAQRAFAGRDAETDRLLRLWNEALCGLAGEVDTLVGRVDWVTKRWLFEQFMQREEMDWDDPVMKSLDLEFHQVDPARGLTTNLAVPLPGWDVGELAVAEAMEIPPANTRASARSRVMRQLEAESVRYFVDWEVIDAEGVSSLSLLDPFDSDPASVEPWLESVRAARARGGAGGLQS